MESRLILPQKLSFKGIAFMASQSAPTSYILAEQFIDRFLAIICHSSRRRILEYLNDASERSVGEIAEHLGLAISTTSEHLAQLQQMRLLLTRKEGKKTYYRLYNKELIQAFYDLIDSLGTHYHQNIFLPSINEPKV